MMPAHRLALLGSLEDQLKMFLTGHPEGHERAGVVLFRRYRSYPPGLAPSDRFVAVEFHPFEDDWLIESSSSHFTYSLRPLRPFFKRCEDDQLVFGLVHSHPSGHILFSEDDEGNERTLMRAITNRNGSDVHFVAMILCDGKWYGRVRHGKMPEQADPVRHIAVIGERLDLNAIPDSRTESDSLSDDSVWARQAAAFGQPFVDM